MFATHALREWVQPTLATFTDCCKQLYCSASARPRRAASRASMIKNVNNRVERRKPHVYSAFMIVATVSQIIFTLFNNRVERRKPYVYSSFTIVATVSQIIFTLFLSLGGD